MSDSGKILAAVVMARINDPARTALAELKLSHLPHEEVCYWLSRARGSVAGQRACRILFGL